MNGGPPSAPCTSMISPSRRCVSAELLSTTSWSPTFAFMLPHLLRCFHDAPPAGEEAHR